jgi:hypothetical protein
MNDNELRKKIIVDLHFYRFNLAAAYRAPSVQDDLADAIDLTSVENIFDLITAERAKWEVEARIDELKQMWNKTQPDIIPFGSESTTDEAEYLSKRIKELEK